MDENCKILIVCSPGVQKFLADEDLRKVSTEVVQEMITTALSIGEDLTQPFAADLSIRNHEGSNINVYAYFTPDKSYHDSFCAVNDPARVDIMTEIEAYKAEQKLLEVINNPLVKKAHLN